MEKIQFPAMQSICSNKQTWGKSNISPIKMQLHDIQYGKITFGNIIQCKAKKIPLIFSRTYWFFVSLKGFSRSLNFDWKLFMRIFSLWPRGKALFYGNFMANPRDFIAIPKNPKQNTTQSDRMQFSVKNRKPKNKIKIACITYFSRTEHKKKRPTTMQPNLTDLFSFQFEK